MIARIKKALADVLGYLLGITILVGLILVGIIFWLVKNSILVLSL